MRIRVVAVAAALCVLVLAPLARAGVALAADNPIGPENQQQGSFGWLPRAPIADDVNGQIKGFASKTSVAQSDTITLYVTVNPAQSYTIDFYRLGWYGGFGGRLRLHVGPFAGVQQPPCDQDSTTGLLACNWAASYTLTVPADWTSGLYLAVLINEHAYENYVPFVVRDGRAAAFVVQYGFATDEAYNNYPNDSRTGKSLYSFNSAGPNTIAGDPRAVKVSFDRPYTGYGFSQFDTVEFIRWVERSGYDVTYVSDLDTHENGADLLRHSALISMGHDEYWSKPMYDAAEAARDAGVNLAFLAADAVSWQVRFEPSASGASDRVVVCYRNISLDPVFGPTTTASWRTAPVPNRPEQTLRGIQFTGDVPYGNNVDYRVTNSSHWAYAGTGFKDGDTVPGIVGYEMDRFMPNYAAANSSSFTLLSDSPFTDILGGADHANSSIYQAPSGAWVFSSGTISWTWGLDGFFHGRADARIQRTTSNILNAFLFGAPTLQALGVAAPATATPGQSFNVTVTARDAQGQPFTGYTGTVHFTSSDTSTGVVLPPDSTLTNGEGTFAVTLVKAGAQTLTVADVANSLSTTVNVNVGAQSANHLVLGTTATPTAGQSFTFTVSAQDQFGNADPAYAGRIHFTSSDTSAGVVLPADSTLTSGQGTFSATLIATGPQTITATDTATASITGTLTTSVRAAAAASLSLSAPASATAGQAAALSVTAKDQFGNVATGYTGTIHFTSSDTSAGVVLPPDSRLTNGQGTFSATLTKAGAQTVTAKDTVAPALTATATINVVAASASTLVLTAPPTTTAGQAFTVNVTLKDRFGNVATGYTGRVHFSSSDTLPLVVLPPDYTFTGGDAGSHSFSVTLVTPPSQTITVTDVGNPSLTATRTVGVGVIPPLL